MTLDTKQVAMGLGALGILAGAAVGIVKITTPEAAQCAVDLSAAKARLEMLDEVKQSCKTALQACVATAPVRGIP